MKSGKTYNKVGALTINFKPEKDASERRKKSGKEYRGAEKGVLKGNGNGQQD